MDRAALHIVSGPTSAGKSQYIEAHPDSYDEVVLPSTLDSVQLEPGRRYALHYNLLRPLGREHRLQGERSVRARLQLRGLRKRLDAHGLYDNDPTLEKITSLPADIRATVLICAAEELERRIKGRTVREPLREGGKSYPNERWLAVLQSVDLGSTYDAWFSYLDAKKISYDLVVSSGGGFDAIERADVASYLATP